MLKEKIQNREKTIGMHVGLSDTSIGRIAGLGGYDFVWVDLEHTYLSCETLFRQILAIKLAGGQVIVRVPQDDLTVTKKVLEMGVDGIIFPMIKSAEEANRLISYTLYPPYGIRGFGPMNAVDYGFQDVAEYVRTNHQTMCRFIQIEHVQAVEHLEEIIQNDFIDGYIIGPQDLSGSIGQLGNVFGDDVTALVRRIVSTLKANGKYIGLSSGDKRESTIQHWRDMGIDMLSCGGDFDFLADAVRENKQRLEQVFLQGK